MEIEFSARFRKQYQKADKKIKKAFYKRLKLFRQDPFYPLLNNHLLIGRYREYRSINITGDWRAIYSRQRNIIVFEMLGTHSQLYK